MKDHQQIRGRKRYLLFVFLGAVMFFIWFYSRKIVYFIAILFSNNIGLLVLSLISVLILIRLLLFQVSIYKIIPGQAAYSENITTFLEAQIGFYRGRYFKSVYIAALSNPFLFISGMMIYFYFKYGAIRTLQLDDYLVFSLVSVLGFYAGRVRPIRHYSFQIRQLESCLNELDENRIDEKTLRKKINRRIRNILIWILFLVSGLLVFFYLIKGK